MTYPTMNWTAAKRRPLPELPTVIVTVTIELSIPCKLPAMDAAKAAFASLLSANACAFPAGILASNPMEPDTLISTASVVVVVVVLAVDEVVVLVDVEVFEEVDV